ncbi:replication endonuclease [Providencia rettgeri]
MSTQEHNSDVYISMRRQQEANQPGLTKSATLAERIMWETNPDDLDFQKQFVGDMPNSLSYYFATQYVKIFKSNKSGRRAANTYLRERGTDVIPRYNMVSERYKIEHGSDFNSFPTKVIDRLNNLHQMGKKAIKELALSFANHIIMLFREYCEMPEKITPIEATTIIFKRIGTLVSSIGTTPPYWKQFNAGRKRPTENKMLSGLLRMMSEKWWSGRLKRMRDIRAEHFAIAVGQVQSKASPYVSRKALSEWKEQKRLNREFIKSFDLQNENGEKVSLEEMVLGSVSNPAVRRCELMVRMRGFENLADDMGYVGEFYTMTAPSKYHNAYSKGGFVDQWNGCSPRDAQKYLCNVFSKIRAEYGRKEIRPFGFRVVEPHHDATPHWHLLLFVHPDHAETLRNIFAKYAREEDSKELNSEEAKKARFHAVPIDKEKGSATGYIAKYISKNIDGYALDEDVDIETGKSCKDIAKNISAWAARWKIRQFQQVGGAPVTVWRELRRLSGEEYILSTEDMDNVRFAADIGDWYAYTELQGGATVARKNLTVRLSYEVTEMGNEYGEDVQRINGVYSPIIGEDSNYLTRVTKWQLVAKDNKAATGDGLDFDPAWSSVNNCTQARRTIKDKETVIPDIVKKAKEIGITLDPEKDPFMIHSIAKGAIYRENGQSVRFHANGHIQKIITKADKTQKSLARCESAISRIQQRIKENGKNSSRAQSGTA